MTSCMFTPGKNVLPLLPRSSAPHMLHSCDTPESRLTHPLPLRLGVIVPPCHVVTRRHDSRHTMHPEDDRFLRQNP